MSDGNGDLRSALQVLSAETRDAGAGPRVRAGLLQELRKRQRKAVMLRWWPAVAMAALVLGVWLGIPRAEVPAVPAGGSQTTAVGNMATAEPSPEVETPAVVPAPAVRAATYSVPSGAKQLSPLTPWYIHPGIPQARQGHIVYMEVGPETARLFGLASTGPLQAQVYLGDDGLARAIRLVRTTQIAKGE